MTRLSAKQARQLGIMPCPALKKKQPKEANCRWDAKILPGGCVWISIPEIPPSLNVWSRWHWAKRNRYLNELSRNMTWLAKYAKLPRYDRATVQVVYYFGDLRPRDKDNYSGKFLLDALRHGGIIAEDNSAVLGLPEPDFRVDKVSPRTEIFVWEVK